MKKQVSAASETEPLLSERLVAEFGGRSALGRRLLAGRTVPEGLQETLEAYYAAVVCQVVEHILGAPGLAAVTEGLPQSVLSPAERWRQSVGEQLAGWDMAGLPDSPPAVDLFGPLYQDLFPRTLRHALGEYYTPAWLAEHVLDTIDYSGLRLLDPTCGSGIFLLAAIGRIRAEMAKDVACEELGRRILDRVAGFDVNPLAVLTARANCLLAVRDLLPAGPPCPAPAIELRDVVLDETEPCEEFDFVVGNPPWVAWDNLAADYRERTKPLWRQYGLFSLTGTQARHGGGKKDLSALVLYRAADRYLRRGGRLGFVITQTLFQTKGAGDGFRRFRLGETGEPLGVLRVDDLTAARPFAEASNWTAAIALEKGRETQYPVPYVKWRETGAEAGDGSAERCTRTTCRARPIDANRPRSPWIVLPEGLARDLTELTGPSDYTAHLGANTGGANGVYWVEVIGPTERTHLAPRDASKNDALTTRNEHVHARGNHVFILEDVISSGVDMAPQTVVIRNLASKGKHSVEQVESRIEPELLYPLVRWGDLARWRAVASTYLLLTQDAETRSGIDEATMASRWPGALAYLTRFRELLVRRAAYRRYQSAGPFWSMYNVGPYTLAPVKVVWRRMDRRINAAVVEPVDDPLLGRRPVVVQETCVLVAVDSPDEAHYLAAVLNSAPANFLVTAHSVRGGKGFGTPSMMDYLDVRRYDPSDATHRRLAELSRESHRLAANDRDTTETQREIDRRAALLWGLGTDELAAITAKP